MCVCVCVCVCVRARVGEGGGADGWQGVSGEEGGELHGCRRRAGAHRPACPRVCVLACMLAGM